jgi:DNA-binding transcriptional regulator LsrR (DeoR family)
MTQDADPNPLDEAARAGWLSYVGGLTQDQIAAELGISRQRAQRLVSRAMAEGLIHVRLHHRIGACLDLETALKDRFGLSRARVMPALGPGADPVRAIAPAAAAELERVLRMPAPLTIALGTGRALRGMVDAIDSLEAPHHRLVSLIGNIAPDGSASFFDVVMRLADKIHAAHYPMLVPVISPTAEENAAFHALPPVRRVVDLAERADVVFVGVGQMSDDAPLLQDGFVSRAELHHHRHRQQRRHDPHAEADGRLHRQAPRHQLEWVTLEENVLRERVTTDIATKGGQYDVLTIGTYEVPIWAKQGWLVPLTTCRPTMTSTTCSRDPRRPVGRRQALSPRRSTAKLAMVMYRTDLERPPADHARRADLDRHRRGRRQDDRQGKASTASACAARPAGARTWPS